MTINDPLLFDEEVPTNEFNHARVTFFVDRSEDRLGRLAEINKTQLEQALRDVKSFARTDAGFNQRQSLNQNISTSSKKDHH